MKKIMAVMLAVLMLVSVTACGSGSNGSSKSGETVVLRVNGQQNDDHQTTKALYRIAEKIEEETNGGLKLDIYTDFEYCRRRIRLFFGDDVIFEGK